MVLLCYDIYMANLDYSITINAPKEKVWHTMLDLNTYKQWTEAFFPGSYYEGSWKAGSEIKFVAEVDGVKSGIQGRIAENIPNEYISIEYLGELKDGQLKTAGDSSIWVGAHENYHFAEENGLTTVNVELIAEHAGEELAKTFDGMWPKALEKLKEICEKV